MFIIHIQDGVFELADARKLEVLSDMIAKAIENHNMVCQGYVDIQLSAESNDCVGMLIRYPGEASRCCSSAHYGDSKLNGTAPFCFESSESCKAVSTSLDMDISLALC